MKNNFDLIIFDWDGTLIDSIDWIAQCLQAAGESCGFAVPEQQQAKDVIGLSIDHAIKKLFPMANAEEQQNLINYYAEAYFSKEICPEDLFSGVVGMLEKLRESGFQLAVATGKTRNGLNVALSKTLTKEFFCVTRCADETASKPDPKMLNEILHHTAIAKTRALMVGDSAHDLQMANYANIAAVAVSCGAHSTAVLQHYQPMLCLPYATDLLAYLSD
ncbi:MAG: HAD-IA family hydrolase [Methylovulum sp.]|jgi:phosphoglycolate phosphatase